VFNLADKIPLMFRAWRYRYRLDRAEISYLLGQLKPGDTVVDIGAHKGGYSYWMLRAVGKSGQVFAFEPQPALAQYLFKIKALFRFDNFIPNHCGLSSMTGELSLSVPSNGVSPGASFESGLLPGAQQVHQVKVDTLDHYFASFPDTRIAFIKCDVEGHELEVFRGGEQLLRTQRPVLMFECEERHHLRYRSQDVFDFLMGLGYSGSFFYRGKLEPLEKLPELGQAGPGSPGYINNFIFYPAAKA
jgi:FkbM family methyltransferase